MALEKLKRHQGIKEVPPYACQGDCLNNAYKKKQ